MFIKPDAISDSLFSVFSAYFSAYFSVSSDFFIFPFFVSALNRMTD